MCLSVNHCTTCKADSSRIFAQSAAVIYAFFCPHIYAVASFGVRDRFVDLCVLTRIIEFRCRNFIFGKNCHRFACTIAQTQCMMHATKMEAKKSMKRRIQAFEVVLYNMSLAQFQKLQVSRHILSSILCQIKLLRMA